MKIIRVDDDTPYWILEGMESLMKQEGIRPAGTEDPFLYIQNELNTIIAATYYTYGLLNSSFSFAVDKEFQGQGLGRQMFEEILKDFISQEEDDNELNGVLEIISTHPATTTLCRDAGAKVEWENDKSTKFTLTVNQIKKHQKHRKRLAELTGNRHTA
jgi:GNAT superfamily N-acetyltransferase